MFFACRYTCRFLNIFGHIQTSILLKNIAKFSSPVLAKNRIMACDWIFEWRKSSTLQEKKPYLLHSDEKLCSFFYKRQKFKKYVFFSKLRTLRPFWFEFLSHCYYNVSKCSFYVKVNVIFFQNNNFSYIYRLFLFLNEEIKVHFYFSRSRIAFSLWISCTVTHTLF